jgi:hypothetical protein
MKRIVSLLLAACTCVLSCTVHAGQLPELQHRSRACAQAEARVRLDEAAAAGAVSAFDADAAARDLEFAQSVRQVLCR